MANSGTCPPCTTPVTKNAAKDSGFVRYSPCFFCYCPRQALYVTYWIYNLVLKWVGFFPAPTPNKGCLFQTVTVPILRNQPANSQPNMVVCVWSFSWSRFSFSKPSSLLSLMSSERAAVSLLNLHFLRSKQLFSVSCNKPLSLPMP